MHIEFLVEEQSAEAALSRIVPAIIGPSISVAIRRFQGKHDLLGKLPARLAGYRRWLPPDHRIVVLVDADRDDCRALKQRLERMAREANLVTRTAAGGSADYQVINRLAIEELEAWFFGDIPALMAAYPGVPPTLGRQRAFRDPDAIRGGTWEALERVLQRAGHHVGGLAKVEAAGQIAAHTRPEHNRSRSFQVFREALLALVQ
jgi:hypothetical protein